MDNHRDAPGKASRWFGVAQPKSAKTNVNILHQEELIAQKKREIEARLEQQARQNYLSIQQLPLFGEDEGSENEASVSNKFVNDGSFLQQFLKLQKEKSSTEPPPSSTNNSANTSASNVGKKPMLFGKRPGQVLSSMLHQVKNYSHSKQTPVVNRLSVFQSPDEDEEEDYEQWLEIKVLPPEDAETRQVVEKLARFVAEGGPELEKVAMEDYKDNPAFSFLHDKNSREFLYYRKKVAEIRKENQSSQASSSEKVSPPEDEETKNFAEKLARFIADGGPEVEAIALQNNRENHAFRFLYEPNSKGYKYYRQKLEEFRKAKTSSVCAPLHLESSLKRKTVPEASPSPSCLSSLPPSLPSPLPLPSPSSSLTPSDQTATTTATTTTTAAATTATATATATATGTTKKKRKSRWGPEEDKVELPLPQLVQHQLDSSPSPLSVQDLKGLGYEKGKPVGLVGVTELSEAQKKQLKEQQEMQQMYDMIMKHKRAMQEMQMMWEKAIQQHQHGYDSDEEVDSELGTWEHQLRRMEMDKTREWAEQLTQMGRGKHFIGDFLPPDELEKFMETFKALKEGREPDYSEYKEFKLTVENIGYQMLMKMGWKEGEGLGSDGQGIKNPVSKGTTAVDGAGFGIDRPAELTKEDDEYEAFRKRMMLAYRFRPNPLNNPRRPYY
ncbi:SURP and G-patch domain-containing protein 1 isoform X1 [Apteryx mantelli]|uniref:SURP and G-patch domain-containing protein 1 n=1 Tax=Apteryx mantelli TaxID=2696672 RepID=A0A8B7JKY0_9AVES|nr:PREDICTED: SURP and G-patch domain-containing protein 1 isoform X1 [Apteryx mantelli mantelli]XP_025920540.1 SURP and G-patch domain-containing protein 1 [Apteryx rowi]